MPQTTATLDPRKFRDPVLTARGGRRAQVSLAALDTLWISTGTPCNLTCQNCYIESSPRNDRLAYLTAAGARGFLDEIAREGRSTRTIGFTGGEPFMNPELPAMLDDALARGCEALVLTNATRPMAKTAGSLLALRERHGARLAIRVSLDHYAPALHDAERGPRTWQPTVDGLRWLAAHGFAVAVAGRGLPIDAADPAALVLFPEMDAGVDVPEITESCWGIPGKSPPSCRLLAHGRAPPWCRAGDRGGLHPAALRARIRAGRHAGGGCPARSGCERACGSSRAQSCGSQPCPSERARAHHDRR